MVERFWVFEGFSFWSLWVADRFDEWQILSKFVRKTSYLCSTAWQAGGTMTPAFDIILIIISTLRTLIK